MDMGSFIGLHKQHHHSGTYVYPLARLTALWRWRITQQKDLSVVEATG